MIYLDYSATTPILLDVLDSYNKASKDYIGNQKFSVTSIPRS